MANFNRFIVSFLFFSVTIAEAAILHVPASYTTIHSAVTAAASCDTILLVSGTYTDTLSLPVNITVASGFIIDGDTNTIASTIWRATYSRPLIYSNSNSLTLSGIRVESAEPSLSGCQIIKGVTHTLIMDHCYFIGTFFPGNADRYQDAAIALDGTSIHPVIIISNCHYFGSATAIMPWIAVNLSTSRFIMTDCTVEGRGNSRNSVLVYVTDTLRVQRTVFSHNGYGPSMTGIAAIIDSCQFKSIADFPLTIGSGIVTNCLFDSCFLAWNPYPDAIITSLHGADTIRNCLFSHNTSFYTDLTPSVQKSLIMVNMGSVQVVNCEIENNTFAGSLLSFNEDNCTNGNFDSTSIHDNTFAWGCAVYDTLLPQLHFSKCDFDRNQFTQNGNVLYNTSVGIATAPDCWWGDATGPEIPTAKDKRCRIASILFHGERLPSFQQPEYRGKTT